MASDGQTVRWNPVCAVPSYSLYRGLLSDLVDADDDGLPDVGYGICINDLDADTSDTSFFDPDVPASGAGFFYLMSSVDAQGQESGLGTTSAGLPRGVLSPCP